MLISNQVRKTIALTILFFAQGLWAQNALVFQTDFGLEEPAVASMKGVAYGVSSELKMFDITHEIPVFNIWEAAYRLNQTAKYWPSGTVFVSVVDPGVGTNRKSVVLKTKSGHYFVSPDNGSLTLVAEKLGIAELREIDEVVNRLKGSEESHTFHGRDVYAYTGARLAAGKISFEQVGKILKNNVVSIEYKKPVLGKNKIEGNIPILDIHYGNVWTNIDSVLFKQLGVKSGDMVWVKIFESNKVLFEQKVKFVSSFGGVNIGSAALYVNDILNIGIAINQGNFAAQYNIEPGPNQNIEIWH
jgi:S-adenosylmethionine hydrolase